MLSQDGRLPSNPRPAPIPRRAAIAALLALAAGGCGYHIRPPYRRDIRTVYVPIFKSQTFRRNMNLELTKMLQDEIMNRTPYKVVGSPEGADSTLEGTITFVDKNIQVENPNNLPRQLQGTILATVRWIDNRTSEERKKEITPVPVVESYTFSPEVGETSQLGFHQAMEKMVRQIVGMMEDPWLGE